MTYEAFSYRSRDGLNLAGRDYRPDDAAPLPVVCLPGLTRTVRDFHTLASLLKSQGRRVLSFDYRGRGNSDRDPSGESYTPPVEAQDVLDGMAARGVARATIVGTSRGGILAMTIGALKPEVIAGVVLNDIGSRIETAGLVRIRSYVGKGQPPADWDDAVRILRARFGSAFPAYSDEDWIEQAHQTFADQGGRPVIDYDPLLARGLEVVTPETPPVDLSAVFATLAPVPVMVIRGSETDLLTPETVAAMSAAHPGLVAVEAPGEGHPPMLRGALASRIAAFIATLR